MLSQSCLKRSSVSTLSSVFKKRVDLSPQKEAFRFFNSEKKQWQSITWLNAYKNMLDVRDALLKEAIQTGERIVLVMDNSPTWIYIEQAALYMNLVVVALPPSLLADNICQIAEEVHAKMIFIESDSHWPAIALNPFVRGAGISVVCHQRHKNTKSARYFSDWIKAKKTRYITSSTDNEMTENSLATIIYTSGSCDKPKGVKHSHKNIINNAFACLARIDVNDRDKMLSVTPVSHCLERIAGYYVAIIAGASITFPKLPGSILENLADSKATIIVTTPHQLSKAYKRFLGNLIFSSRLVEQYLDYQLNTGKWRLSFLCWPIIRRRLERKAKKQLLHQLRFVICGGASLSSNIIALSQLLNLPVLQGYGLTEAGGVVSANAINQNMPHSVGKALSNCELKISDDHELLVKNDSLMLGYWNEEKTKLLADNWLPTTDLARLENDYLFIDGRKNRTIHLSTGEAVLPLPIERALLKDNLFEHVMLAGENREKVYLLCQLNRNEWQAFRKKYANNEEKTFDDFTPRLKSILLLRINLKLRTVPGHPRISLIYPSLEPWSVENGLLNAQGKINKQAVELFFSNDIAQD
ncbi:MAG TPA: hypothetical protein ENK06_03855 [Gammaproteobacteria bacterium]|nr:hypothetical protein [Gammaproteobacteria bacterium]